MMRKARAAATTVHPRRLPNNIIAPTDIVVTDAEEWDLTAIFSHEGGAKYSASWFPFSVFVCACVVHIINA